MQCIARDFCFQSVGDLGDAEVFRDLGTDLSGVAVDGLLSAEDRVEGSFLFGDQLDRLRQDVTGCERMPDTRYALSAAMARHSRRTASA